MEQKAKITVEVPRYLKDWIQAHDVSQNALVTMALRSLYLQEKNASESLIVKQITEYFENKKLPF